MDFNVNYEVYVRLTDEGRSLHKKAHDELEAHIRSVSPKVKPVAYQRPEEDGDGWSKWLLWELMASFGAHMYNGCRPPFELNIRIPDTALEAKLQERNEEIERLRRAGKALLKRCEFYSNAAWNLEPDSRKRTELSRLYALDSTSWRKSNAHEEPPE